MSSTPNTVAGELAELGTADTLGAYCGTCGEHVYPAASGAVRCFNIGACTVADTAASRQSLRRGRASSAPAAWTISGRVD